jgi:hypothetical protein
MARNLRIFRQLVGTLRELVGIFTVKPAVEKIKEDFSICVKSCKNSKINFFFQVINFCLTIYLIRFIFPNVLNIVIGLSLSFFVLCLVNLLVYPMKIFFQNKKATGFFFVILVLLTISIKTCVKANK